MVTKILLVVSQVTWVAVFGYLEGEHIQSSISKDMTNEHPEYGHIPHLNRKIVFCSHRGISEHPYVANIMLRGSHYMTGTILNRNVVITVADRLVGVPTELLTVVAGQTYNDRGAPEHQVILKVIHSSYDKTRLRNNLCLLRIHSSFQFRMEVKSLPLFELSGKIEEGMNGFVSGWGRCDSLQSHVCLPRELVMYRGELWNPGLVTAYISVNETNSRECIYGYGKIGLTLDEGELCAGSARRHELTAPCLGIPGAPLVVHGSLLGILSWGWGCGRWTDLPLVYVNLRHYNEWIMSNTHTLTNKIGLCASRTLFDACMGRVFHNASVAYIPTEDKSISAIQPLLPLFTDSDIYL